jgi:hypothetical protein
MAIIDIFASQPSEHELEKSHSTKNYDPELSHWEAGSSHAKSYVKILPRKTQHHPPYSSGGRDEKTVPRSSFLKTNRRRKDLFISYLLFSERYAVTIQNTETNVRVQDRWVFNSPSSANKK